MDALQRYEHIQTVRSEYFQSLLQGAAKEGIIGSAQVKKIQVGLLGLLSKQIEKYTLGESSSVTAESAESLLKSICFSISVALKCQDNVVIASELLEHEGIEELFKKGNELIRYYFEDAKRLWIKIKTEGPKISNLAYNDTVFIGLKEFFDWYDYRFSAHEINGSLDYPLSYDEMDLKGIEYIHEYLTHLDMENGFCSHYDSHSIECLMRGYSKYFREDLLNVFELVLTNLLGRSILGYKLDRLDISEEDREWLLMQLKKADESVLVQKMERAFYEVLSFMEVESQYTIEYFKITLKNIISRVKHNINLGKLDKVFITLYEKEDENLISGYIDGNKMEDEDLRVLIDEIKDCRFLDDKIAMVSQSVKSLDDLSEVLNECFFEGEYESVFKLLDKREIQELKKRINENKTDSSSFYEWECEFLRFAVD
ncbi:DUF6179 domain-containing protein [Ruminiclostridium papyrosolvens]|uniref:DUF6179 domain-containing protein n=1 Tax=Ruminiclostridium papyrosolvens TaxID=29362 RepID=UPI000418A572|nr:DUF6179 domain-containing protein [Ruminiclostridium papyrosolvens]